jgi:hypothetical protein
MSQQVLMKKGPDGKLAFVLYKNSNPIANKPNNYNSSADHNYNNSKVIETDDSNSSPFAYVNIQATIEKYRLPKISQEHLDERKLNPGVAFFLTSLIRYCKDYVIENKIPIDKSKTKCTYNYFRDLSSNDNKYCGCCNVIGSIGYLSILLKNQSESFSYNKTFNTYNTVKLNITQPFEYNKYIEIIDILDEYTDPSTTYAFKYGSGMIAKNKDFTTENNKTLYIILRGSMEPPSDDFVTNVSYTSVTMPELQNKDPLFDDDTPPLIHSGFKNAYLRNIRDRIFTNLQLLIDKNLVPKNIIITGHSLGAAVCSILTYDLSININHMFPNKQYENTDIFCYSFGSPRPGDYMFSTQMENIQNAYGIGYRLRDYYTIINNADIVPQLPLGINIPKSNSFVDRILDIVYKQQYYSHITNIICYPHNVGNVSDNHTLTTYDQMVAYQAISISEGLEAVLYE